MKVEDIQSNRINQLYKKAIDVSNIRMDRKKFGTGVDTGLPHTIPSSLEHIHHNSMVQSAG